MNISDYRFKIYFVNNDSLPSSIPNTFAQSNHELIYGTTIIHDTLSQTKYIWTHWVFEIDQHTLHFFNNQCEYRLDFLGDARSTPSRSENLTLLESFLNHRIGTMTFDVLEPYEVVSADDLAMMPVYENQ